MFLILFFFASTTGLPVTIHLCKMEETTGAKGCLMHNKPVKTSCCEEVNDYRVFLSSSNPICCQTKTIDNSIFDSYLIQKPEIKSELTGTPLFLNTDIYNYKSTTNKFPGITDTSPPSIQNNYLYLTISSLLI
ncbi:MAG: hypothetical protein Q7S39_01910 [Ignavibacteria bacterium]|nr:hypothetical protein [Ignavibacteria bacterium]